MNKEDLHNTLERLRAEINALGNDADPMKIQSINSLIGDLEQEVQELEDPGHRATMRDRLIKLIGQLETRHPAITSMLDKIATSLAGLGI